MPRMAIDLLILQLAVCNFAIDRNHLFSPRPRDCAPITRTVSNESGLSTTEIPTNRFSGRKKLKTINENFSSCYSFPKQGSDDSHDQ